MYKSALFEVILGTYEEFLVGYKFNPKSEELVQSFASHSHANSIRCVAFSDYYLASGGADDRIVVYDLRSRKEHCMLTHHNATVNCLKFTPEHTHLISGSSDGVLAITRLGNWQVEKLWEKAHKGAAVVDIAVHSSGKLMLTLGADATIRTWNLIKGRQAYAININSKYKNAKLMQFINWAPNDVNFVLCGGNTSDIWSIESGGISTNLEHKNKVTNATFMDNDTLLVGFENGELKKFAKNGKSVKTVQAHTTRVKSLDVRDQYIVTCSSNGEVKVFNFEFEEIAKCSTGCRYTCLLLVPTIKVKTEPETDDIEIIPDASPKKTNLKANVQVLVEEDEKQVKEEKKTKVKRKKVEFKSQIESSKKSKKKKKL